MENVMLDLETWGTCPGCAIRSIGAVVFDPISGETGEEFYANVDDVSCLDIGLVKELQTIDWWRQQTKEAQESLLKDPLPIMEVIDRFRQWFIRSRGIFIWSQGANFDEPIIHAAFRRTKRFAPW